MSLAEFRHLPARLLVVSPVLPPNDSGQAVVLSRLLGGFDPADYRLASFGAPGLGPGDPAVRIEPLPGKTFLHHELRDWYTPGAYAGRRVRLARRLLGTVRERAAVLAGIARRECCQAILVASGDLPDVPAAVLAGKLAGIPVLLHFFDHWRDQAVEPDLRWLAARFEPAAARAAAAVIVPNEFLRDTLARAYGIDPFIVRNPTDNAALAGRRESSHWPMYGDRIRVLYTGQIYDAQRDAVARLLTAIAAPDLSQVELHVYTAQSVQSLRDQGLAGKLIHHPHVGPPEIYRLQQEADILLLALGFETRFPGIIRTSATTKLADYLASGRPTLIHAPGGSFPAWYARRHDCGLVVDKPEPDMLAAAIRVLRDNPGLRARLGQAGLAQARADFAIAEAQDRLIEVVSWATRSRSRPSGRGGRSSDGDGSPDRAPEPLLPGGNGSAHRA